MPGRRAFQSTSPARGTTIWDTESARAKSISIHVPREGDDVVKMAARLTDKQISIHVPREGDDHFPRLRLKPQAQFQSTSPARGTTPQRLHQPYTCQNFNPRPPRGGRPNCILSPLISKLFQSTSPARGTTSISRPYLSNVKSFQSTSPARGTTAKLHSARIHYL